MSDAAPGGSGPTNKTRNEKGGSNEGHRKSRNGCRPYRSVERYITEKLKWKVEGMLTLGVKEDKKRINSWSSRRKSTGKLFLTKNTQATSPTW